ncbi:MAG: hypothetical protein KDD64_15785, partial [Bdellovibrionales bacterium]|nr:hypothetical protein [Bdellovibrionales bacterium]
MKLLAPILFAEFFVLLFYARHVDLFPFQVVFWPSVAVALGVGALFAVLYLGKRNSAFASVASILAISEIVLISPFCRGFLFGATGTAWVVGGFLFVVGGFLLQNARLATVTSRGLNFVSAIALLFPLSTVAMHYLRAPGSDISSLPRPSESHDIFQSRPHIVYLSLSGLRLAGSPHEAQTYEGKKFLNSLRGLGLRLFENGTFSARNDLDSLVSVVTMEPPPVLPEGDGREEMNMDSLVSRIRKSKLFDIARKNGYRILVLSSGVLSGKLLSPDLSFDPKSSLNVFSDSILRLSFFNDIQSILSERQQREHSRLSSARLEALLKWLPSVGEFAAPILTIGNVDLSELTVSSSGTKYTLVLQSLRELTSRASRPIIVILQEVGVHSEQQDNPSPRVTLPET